MIETLKEKWAEIESQKRAEIEASIEHGDLADPIFTPAFFISLAVSASLSAASYFLSRAFAPKPPRQQVGKLTGSLQLQNSEQGLFIPEIYGASPATSLVTGSDPTYQNLANVTAGANGALTKTSGGSSWNAGASHNVSISSGQDAFYQFTVLSGYATAGFTLDSSPTSGNTDFLFALQWNPDGSVSVKYSSTQVFGGVTTWASGDTFRLELRSGRFRIFKGSAEIVPDGLIFPSSSYPLFMGIAIQDVGAGISASKVQIDNIGPTPNSGRGGVKVPAIIVWSSGIRKVVSTTQVQTGGGKGGGSRTQTVDNITYNIDLALMFCNRGPYRLLREYGNADILIDQFAQSANPSGVYDPTTGADPNYDPTAPPDPTLNYLTSFNRVDGDIPLDGDGVGTGTIQGGGSSFAIYPGNNTQQPDPTIEADIDARYGAGSTPAYRNRSLVVHNTLSLSRWGGVAPNITAVWEHQTLQTLDDIFGSFCERVGVLAANSDYDFSGIPIECRGLLISGRAFAPKEIIGSPDLQLAYNYFVTEAEGQIIAYEEGSEPSVTIPDTDVGWLEGDAELPDVLPEVESVLAPEISLPREVDVKSIDPDNEWEPNTQNAIRQITDGSAVEILELQITQLSDERRETAQRKLYRDYVAGTAHKFTLPWTYLYLFPGYKVTITRAEGFTHVMRLTSITGGVGLLECEGVALEPETFNQPANGVFPPGYRPPQPIPAMTIVMLLDVPLLKDGDITRNDGVGQYAVGTPRTGVGQNWTGFALYQFKRNEWNIVGSSPLPGTIGVIVSVSSLSTDPNTVDNIGTIVVDLYGTTATLSSVMEAAMVAGANMAIAGNMVFNFATATQSAGFDNRWTLSKLLNGQRGTDSRIPSVAAGQRFVLVDDAVKFIPMEREDLNVAMDYRAVTSGQSLGDAATVTETWTGQSLRIAAPTDLTAAVDESLNWHLQMVGADNNAGNYVFRVRRHSDGVLMRDISVIGEGGTSFAAVFSDVARFGTGSNSVVVNNNVYAGYTGPTGTDEVIIVRSAQEITGPGSFIEAIADFNHVADEATHAQFQSFDLVASSLTTWSTAGDAGAKYMFQLTGGNADRTTSVVHVYETQSGSLTEIYSAAVKLPTRIRMTFVGTQVRFYVDWVNSDSRPIVVGTYQLIFPLKLVVRLLGGNKAENVRIGGLSRPQTIYSTAQQIADNVSHGGPASALNDITVEGWEVSPEGVVGFSTPVTRFQY